MCNHSGLQLSHLCYTISMLTLNASKGNLNMGLILGIGVVFWTLGQLLSNDEFVKRDQAFIHLILHLQMSSAQMLMHECL